MRQIILAGIALILGGLGFALTDEPKNAVTSAAAREFAAIKKKFEAEEKELKMKLASTDDADEKKRLTFSIKELSAITANDAVELAEKHPKDEAGLDAALFALKLLGEHRVTGRDMDKAIAIVLDNHVDNLKIQVVLVQMISAGPSGQQFMKTVAEKSTKKEVQGLAFYYLAQSLSAESAQHEAEGYNVSSEKLRAEAVEMMEKAVKLAPEAKVGAEPLAKIVAAELVSLKIGVGNPLPEVEGINLDGKKVKLSSFQGKVVLFDFWATWCGPCIKMIPHERDLFDKQSKKGFTLLSVNVDEEKSALTEFLAMEKMPWDHWWDGQGGPIAKLFRVRAYPTLLLIDAKGIVRKKWVGVPGEEVLDKAIAELVAELQNGKD